MRKDQVELIGTIDKLLKNQIYLLEIPRTPQQAFLQLFGHRILVKKNMFHKNIDKIVEVLQGTFAQSTLKLSYTTVRIENRIQLGQQESPLIRLIDRWINFYPTVRSKPKYLLNEFILQDENPNQNQTINGFNVYLAYLNIISLDIWKIIRGSNKTQEFFVERPIKDVIKEFSELKFPKLDINDLLTFTSGCIPKVLLNVILENESLPQQIKGKTKKYQCLYSNQNVQFYLRTYTKLSLLLRQIMLILLTLQLNHVQQKFMMMIAMRYFYVYHFDKKYFAPEIIIYTFNKLDESVKRSLNDQFTLFFKIIIKLGRDKFVDYISKNSVNLKNIIEIVRKKPMIGYSQQSAAPYNTLGISQTINIQRGSSATRSFQILEDYSLFYFRITIPNLDITVKLYYLGEITSEVASKTLLFTHEKHSGELKNCINAIKRGLYMFQFDNSYSWINNKTILFENVIFTPLQIKTVDAYEWTYDFYQNIPQNQIAKQEDILFVENKKPQKKAATYLGTVSVGKKNDLFNLVVNKKDEKYIYETDNPERMEQKVKELINSKEKYKWSVMNKVVDDFSEIDNFVRGLQNPIHDNKEYQRVEQIEEGQFQQEIEDQYEVVEKEVDKSQIFNEERFQKQRQSKKSQKNQSKVQKQSVKETKEVINYDELQTDSFYKTEKTEVQASQ